MMTQEDTKRAIAILQAYIDTASDGLRTNTHHDIKPTIVQIEKLIGLKLSDISDTTAIVSVVINGRLFERRFRFNNGLDGVNCATGLMTYLVSSDAETQGLLQAKCFDVGHDMFMRYSSIERKGDHSYTNREFVCLRCGLEKTSNTCDSR
jgi:hypothetical protein